MTNHMVRAQITHSKALSPLGPRDPYRDFRVALPDLIAIAERIRISPIGCMPNDAEPNGIASEAWAPEHAVQVTACRASIRANRCLMIPHRGWSRADSYALKHRIENEAGSYIANGSVIVAALIEGAHLRKEGPNARFSASPVRVFTDRSDWYWACADDGPAGDRFIIANGQDELWARVRQEISPDEHHVSWDGLCRGGKDIDAAGLLDLVLLVMLPHQVSHNRFMLEVAQIPAFAAHLRPGRVDLCNYVSNPMHLGVGIAPEPYSDEALAALRQRIDATLGVEVG